MQHNHHRLTLSDMEAISRALAYIQREYRVNISAENLSLEVNLPIVKLQAGLKKLTALTLHQYLLRVRIEKAKELLTDTDDPLKSIIDHTGFKEESYFCKVFRRHTRLSPMAFRLQQTIQ